MVLRVKNLNMENTIELEYIQLEKIKNRISIFLDTNIWIDLAEKNDPMIAEVKTKLLNLSKEEKIFCPLDMSTFMEFHRQEFDSIKRLFSIIDSLTLNLAICERNHIYNLEIENFVNNELNNKNENIPRNLIFVPFGCLNGNILKVNNPFPPEDFRSKIFIEANKVKLSKWKFSEYMSHSKPFLPQKYPTDPNLFTDTWKISKEMNNGNKNKMYSMEENYTIKEIMYPLLLAYMKKFNADTQIKFISYVIKNKINLPELPMIWAKKILQNSSLLRNTIEIMSFTSYDINRKGRESDQTDFEVMIASSSYYDILFTRDGWMFDSLSKNKNKLISKTKFFKDYNSFSSYLDTVF